MLNLTLCDKLDKYGYYYLSDLISRKIVAQYIQPSNNQNVPISDRVVPWSALDGDLAQRDYDRVHNDPRFREKEYIVLDGVFEPGAYPSDGGTSNLSPTKTKNIHKDTINKLNKMLAFDLDSHERAAVFKQIDKLEKGLSTGESLMGNPFDMQGPDEVPGPKTAVIDHSSASMVGLDGFQWKNRKFPQDSTDGYKNLLPL